MPQINVSEADFDAVAGAAMDAEERGDIEAAKALDKLARKINATLSAATVIRAFGGTTFGPRFSRSKWQDMPSTLKGSY